MREFKACGFSLVFLLDFSRTTLRTLGQSYSVETPPSHLSYSAIARARESGIIEAMGDMPARVTQHVSSNQLQSVPFGSASNPSSSGKSSASPAGGCVASSGTCKQACWWHHCELLTS